MITFLGTAGDSFVFGRQLRTSGGIVLQIDDNQFHIDPGPGAVVNSAQFGINPRATIAILVSHNHLLHAGDINAAIDAMTYGGFDKKGVLLGNKTSINGEENHVPYLLPFFKNYIERYIAIEAGQKVAINKIEIRATKALHQDPNAVGFIFFTSQYTLGYTGDTKYFKSLHEEFKNANILILNVPLLKKNDDAMQLSQEDAVTLIKEVNPRLAIITHFGTEMMKEDPLYQVREIQKQTGIQTIAARDGIQINPVSYAVSYGQKTLAGFTKATTQNSQQNTLM